MEIPSCENYCFHSKQNLEANSKAMTERYPYFQVEEIQELKENSVNQNTKKSTSTWLNVWTSWAESRNFETNLLSCEAKQLDETLQTFFAEIRKKDGSEYKPGNLRVMLASRERHLREKYAAFSIAKDIEFSNSRKVPEGKARLPRQEGFGKSQTLQRHSPLKTRSSCGPKECLGDILHSHLYKQCGSCSLSTLA